MKTWLWISLVLVMALTAGCATTFPKKAAESDCLILLKTEIADKAHSPTTRNYFLNFSGNYPQQILFQPRRYVAILVHEPGVMIESISTNVAGGTDGSYGKYAVNYTLPYKAGGVIVLDFVYVQTITQIQARTYSSQLSTRRITDEDKADMDAELAALPDYKTWTE